MNIKMAAYLMGAVRTGVKRVTIRDGHRPEYRTGLTTITNAENDQDIIQVDVHTLVFTDVSSMPMQYIYQDGFANVDHMVEAMQKFYPNFSHDSKITIVAWERL